MLDKTKASGLWNQAEELGAKFLHAITTIENPKSFIITLITILLAVGSLIVLIKLLALFFNWWGLYRLKQKAQYWRKGERTSLGEEEIEKGYRSLARTVLGKAKDASNLADPEEPKLIKIFSKN